LHLEIAYGTDLHISLIVFVVPVAISLREGTNSEYVKNCAYDMHKTVSLPEKGKGKIGITPGTSE